MGGLTHDAIRTWKLVGLDVYSHTEWTSYSGLRAKSIDEGYAGKPIRSREISTPSPAVAKNPIPQTHSPPSRYSTPLPPSK